MQTVIRLVFHTFSLATISLAPINTVLGCKTSYYFWVLNEQCDYSDSYLAASSKQCKNTRY